MSAPASRACSGAGAALAAALALLAGCGVKGPPRPPETKNPAAEKPADAPAAGDPPCESGCAPAPEAPPAGGDRERNR